MRWARRWGRDATEKRNLEAGRKARFMHCRGVVSCSSDFLIEVTEGHLGRWGVNIMMLGVNARSDNLAANNQ